MVYTELKEIHKINSIVGMFKNNSSKEWNRDSLLNLLE